MKSAAVHFVTRETRGRWQDIEQLCLADVDPDRFRSGVDVWIAQTYLELRELGVRDGLQVSVGDRFPPDLPAIAHRDDLRVRAGYYRSFLGYTRADRAASPAAAWQVVQSPAQIQERSVLIPSWPQPGLLRRDPARTQISALGFFGRGGSVPGFFRDPAFLKALAQRGITYTFSERNWRDYRSTDVAVALRFDPPIGSSAKPFAKLVNAWFAEVPALLGPEPAFRWLRRSDLDYIEVSSARDILGALDLLQANPGVYQAMVANGIARRAEFTRAAIRTQWLEFIEGQFLPSFARWRETKPSKARRFFDFGRQLIGQRSERHAYKALESAQLAQIRAEGLGERFDPTEPWQSRG
jgi:hypothetical protein